MKHHSILSNYMLLTLIALIICSNSYGKTNVSSYKNGDDEIEMVIKEVEEAQEKGLPLDAKPAAYYFNIEANGHRMVIDDDVNESWVYNNEGNRCFFFVQSLRKDEEKDYVAIWMYEETKEKVSRILVQSENNLGTLRINKMKILQADVPDGDKIERTPMLVLSCMAAGPRPTSSSATIFLHPESRKIKALNDETMIEGVYQEGPQNYITTITRQISEEELSDYEAERRAPKLLRQF